DADAADRNPRPVVVETLHRPQTLVPASLPHRSSRRTALPHEIPDSVLDCCACDAEILGGLTPTDLASSELIGHPRVLCPVFLLASPSAAYAAPVGPKEAGEKGEAGEHRCGGFGGFVGL